MAANSEFQRSIREGDDTVPFAVLRDEVLATAERLVRGDPSIGAIVCECTNLTPYAYDMHRLSGLPVFDMVTLAHWFHRGLSPQVFPQS
jgi:hypothetical protein